MSKTVQCHKCGKNFEAKRSTAKFCSASCRSGYHQRGSQVDIDLMTIRECLMRISTTAREKPELFRLQHDDDLYTIFMQVDRLQSDVVNAINQEKNKRYE